MKIGVVVSRNPSASVVPGPVFLWVVVGIVLVQNRHIIERAIVDQGVSPLPPASLVRLVGLKRMKEREKGKGKGERGNLGGRSVSPRHVPFGCTLFRPGFRDSVLCMRVCKHNEQVQGMSFM